VGELKSCEGREKEKKVLKNLALGCFVFRGGFVLEEEPGEGKG